jgi:hypothetical protein
VVVTLNHTQCCSALPAIADQRRLPFTTGGGGGGGRTRPIWLCSTQSAPWGSQMHPPPQQASQRDRVEVAGSGDASPRSMLRRARAWISVVQGLIASEEMPRVNEARSACTPRGIVGDEAAEAGGRFWLTLRVSCTMAPRRVNWCRGPESIHPGFSWIRGDTIGSRPAGCIHRTRPESSPPASAKNSEFAPTPENNGDIPVGLARSIYADRLQRFAGAPSVMSGSKAPKRQRVPLRAG